MIKNIIICILSIICVAFYFYLNYLSSYYPFTVWRFCNNTDAYVHVGIDILGETDDQDYSQPVIAHDEASTGRGCTTFFFSTEKSHAVKLTVNYQLAYAHYDPKSYQNLPLYRADYFEDHLYFDDHLKITEPDGNVIDAPGHRLAVPPVLK